MTKEISRSTVVFYDILDLPPPKEGRIYNDPYDLTSYVEWRLPMGEEFYGEEKCWCYVDYSEHWQFSIAKAPEPFLYGVWGKLVNKKD